MKTFKEYIEASAATDIDYGNLVSDITHDCYTKLMDVLWKANTPELFEELKKKILRDLQGVMWEIEEKNIQTRSPRFPPY